MSNIVMFPLCNNEVTMAKLPASVRFALEKTKISTFAQLFEIVKDPKHQVFFKETFGTRHQIYLSKKMVGFKKHRHLHITGFLPIIKN